LPKHQIVTKSVLPDDHAKRERLRDGHDRFVRLYDEQISATTILTDNSSPFALRFGLETQDQFDAIAMASLIAAQGHFLKSASLAEVARALGDYGAFVGMAFASRTLAVSKEVAWWRPIRERFGGFPRRGTGDIDNVVNEAQQATMTAMTDPKARAIDERIDIERKSCFIVYTVPVPVADEKLWLLFSNRMRTWLANRYPTATPVFASGCGAADPRYAGSYWLQASVFFPMPDVPAPVSAILARAEGAKRRRLRGQPVTSTNGDAHVPGVAFLAELEAIDREGRVQ
jgi:hypothetical protein